MHVLDVGCGEGELMSELLNRGITVTGVEISKSAVESCRRQGLDVVEGVAEDLPFPANSFDGIVCSVVIPYTDERKAIAEWARVLKPGGVVRTTYHGIGYGLLYAGGGGDPQRKLRFYGFRMLVNTACYHLTGYRLPGFLGDTLCQAASRLQRFYDASGLTLMREIVVERCYGKPVFLGHALAKPNGD
jgi:SAM-dependent methyltransferase